MKEPRIEMDWSRLLGFDQIKAGGVPMNVSKVGQKTCLSYRAFTAAEPDANPES